MSGGKQTPRQKMIGMMYLVLTALLALNVSKSILDAFIIVNDSLEITNRSFSEKNAKLFVDFNKASANNKVKVEPYLIKAEEAERLSDSLYNYIQEVKKYLIAKVDGYPAYPRPVIPFQNDSLKPEADPVPVEPMPEEQAKLLDSAAVNLKAVVVRDNYDIPTTVLIPEPGMPHKGMAREMKNQMIVYREMMLELIRDPKLPISPNREQILKNLGNLGINTDDPVPDGKDDDPASKCWEGKNFYYMASVAAICIMTKIQNDIKKCRVSGCYNVT